jgi:BirA family transcriptional regulator, biotin operon repressor / biotin---[acetyl-CoA-carboxylase] ligase
VLSAEDLRAALAAIGVTAPVRAEEVTGSTNTLALALAAEGAPEWTLVTAAHQTEGRGRQGRTWADVEGRALLCSLVLRPDMAPDAAGVLALLAGASMAEALAAVTGEDVRCKWPNDLLLGDAKVGGVLLEAGLDGVLRHVVVGVGVNLTAPAGVGGAGAVGARADAAAILTAFLERFAAGYRADARSARARAAWLARNATIGRTVRARTVSGDTAVGEATGLAEDGALQVQTSEGIVEVGFGEIEHLRSA